MMSNETMDIALQYAVKRLSKKSLFDVDIFAVIVKDNGDDVDFVYFNNTSSADGAVNLEPDEELFTVNTDMLAAYVDKIVIYAFSYEFSGNTSFKARKLSCLRDASVVVTSQVSGGTIARFDLPKAKRRVAAMGLIEIYKNEGRWDIRPYHQQVKGGMRQVFESFGVEVASAPGPDDFAYSDGGAE